MQIKKILFINFGGLGDEILFLPAMLSVKEEYPDAEITLAMERRSRGIVSLTDVISHSIYANINSKNKYRELYRLLLKIWKQKYDVVISSGSNKFISIFLFMTFIKKRYGYNTGKLSKMLLTGTVDLNKNQYAAQMYHDLVKPVTAVKMDTPVLSIQKKLPAAGTVLVHPGVSKLSVNKGMTKTISPKVWAEVIEMLANSGKKVLLAGGKDDKDCIKIIETLVPPEKFKNLYGETKNLRALAEEISAAEILLCSDSAPMHIGAALGVKTYAIFGPTDDKKLIPPNGSVVPVKANCECTLRPCLFEKQQTTCEELYCLNIPAEKIVNEVLKK